jgi:hypothetical protein
MYSSRLAVICNTRVFKFGVLIFSTLRMVKSCNQIFLQNNMSTVYSSYSSRRSQTSKVKSVIFAKSGICPPISDFNLVSLLFFTMEF